ncbi:hypothetical protein NW762_013460 [Fusarium torreyae]|uniref:ethanolamine kinase n=1 Tax=Fusarium torreyae TaxID=1237075 RepID=A0A9W8RNY4_9HYPO|nr:hypothetical protein NW762_013460 [Fusarium torreyae]
MEVPYLNHVFDAADPKGSTLQLLPLLFPDRELTDAGLRIQALAQGTTNGLFKVTSGPNDAATQDAVLIKVYGDGTDITIDRDKELRVHKLLADHKLSSFPLVRFANGHAYQFISGDVCTEDDMSQTEVFRGVARELARWHATLPSVDLRDPQKVLDFEPGVWSTAKKWLNAISKHPGRAKTEIDSLHEKFQYLTDKLLLTGNMPEPLVLGHGDLLCGNIIVQESADSIGATDVASVRFIDYEHATYCPRAFELANHFAEWTGFECNYNLIPKMSIRRAFIREYLQTLANISGEHDVTPLPSKKDLPIVSDAEVEHLLRQVDDFRGFPGFYWGLCALIQAETSTGTIDFDYAGYAAKRFAEYEAWRRVHDGRMSPDEELPLREQSWALP